MNNQKKRIKFFGVYIDMLTMDETLARAEEIIARREYTQHVVINVAKLVAVQKDENLRNIVNLCGIISADGQGIVWGARLLGYKIPERVAGIDLMTNLIDRATEKDYKVYFLGATQDVIEKVITSILSKHPHIKIAGYRNGYFSEDEERPVVEAISKSAADILFVGMTSPKKEVFLNKYLKELEVPFTMGVGGSFDVMAGAIKRAPLWMQKAGLEWFCRFLKEPKRMWKRYLVTNSIFFWMLLKQIFRGKKND